MTTQFKKNDIVRVIDPAGFMSPLDKKLKDRDGVIEWVGPDAHGQFKDQVRIRFLKRNGRGKEFTQRMGVRELTYKTVAENLILDVTTVTKDGGDWCVKCPHCKKLVGLPSGPVRGEQFQHNNAGGCGGWFEVTSDARVLHGI